MDNPSYVFGFIKSLVEAQMALSAELSATPKQKADTNGDAGTKRQPEIHDTGLCEIEHCPACQEIYRDREAEWKFEKSRGN